MQRRRSQIMIKIALKHFIYEACIDSFFDRLYKNFVLPKITGGMDQRIVDQILEVSARIQEYSRMSQSNYMLVSNDVAEALNEKLRSPV